MNNEAKHWAERIRGLRQGIIPPPDDWVRAGQDRPDGALWTGWDICQNLPAFRAGDDLVPFMPALNRDDPESDTYSDAAIKARWREVSNDPEMCAQVVLAAEPLLNPPRFQITGTLHPIEPGKMRRPSYFGNVPWREDIADYDDRATVFEVTAPRDPHEVRILGKTDAITLRGWHIAGEGVETAPGNRQRAVVVFIGGRSVETFACHDPAELPVTWDEAAREWMEIPYPAPGKRTEFWGALSWRGYMTAMLRAGFDIVTFDKRGHGLSGGECSSNCGEQANDIFRVLRALEGAGRARFECPGDEASPPLAGFPNLPTFLCGASQGSAVVNWAMHKAFVGPADFEGRSTPSEDAEGFDIRGALLLAPTTSGLGGRGEIQALAEAYLREEQHIQFMPSAEVIAGQKRWPSLFVAKGLWDFLEGVETTLETFERIGIPSELCLVRGGHGESSWGNENITHVQSSMIEFMRGALTETAARHRTVSLRDSVASAPNHWPNFVHAG